MGELMKEVSGKEDMSFDEWLLYGLTRYWNTPPICKTHDGFAITQSEEENDICVHYIRLYKNVAESDQMLEEFPPAYWRSHTRGLEWED